MAKACMIRGSTDDRLLLGLSGMMSEAELHQIKLRMHAGARHKAERGDWSNPYRWGSYGYPATK